MASTYKTFGNGDIINTRTLLHEAIPITGSLISGTYLPNYPSEGNIKKFSHNMFESVYDYPYLSSSANHLFDITFGYSSNSVVSSSSNVQNAKKINIYNTFAQQLVGYKPEETFGNAQVIKEFDRDGDEAGTTDDKLQECYFLSFSRLLVKDEIKKGTFKLDLGVNGNFWKPMRGRMVRINDAHAAGADGSFKINSPAGEYAVLKAKNLVGTPLMDSSSWTSVGGTGDEVPCGLIYYQAGIAILTASLFGTSSTGWPAGLMSASNAVASSPGIDLVGTGSQFNAGITAHMTGCTVSGAADSLRNRIYNLEFNNTTELHSTIYFCRLHTNDFNYSTNQTYLSSSKIVTKNTSLDKPVAYITTVGLYGANNQLLAVAKLSEPLKKTPQNELTLRVRLDY